jgi:hypothetical protein
MFQNYIIYSSEIDEESFNYCINKTLVKYINVQKYQGNL